MNSRWQKDATRSAAALLISAVCLFLLWVLASERYTQFLIPSPAAVIGKAFRLISSGEFLRDFLLTTRRVAAGLGLAFILAVPAAVIYWRVSVLSLAIGTVLLVFNMIPSVLWIFMLTILLGPSESVIILSIFLNTFPRLVNYFISGLRNINTLYESVTKTYRISGALKIRHILLPQLWVVVFPSFRNEIANAWKVAVISEIFGVGNGIGYKIYYSFALFSLRDVLAWVSIFVGFIFLLELGILRPVERMTLRWKHHETSDRHS